jgi:hypothetical protein
MQALKPGVWGVVIGSILTMIVGFTWGGWTTSSTANQSAMTRADAAVTTALIPICLAQVKLDTTKGKKLGEFKAITTSYDQTDFVMKAGWATFPGKADANRDVAEACAAALVKTAVAK